MKADGRDGERGSAGDQVGMQEGGTDQPAMQAQLDYGAMTVRNMH
eukprot:COSAG02_NODE_41915_length_389_cov_1.313793_1_plen_45_part_00